MKIPVIHGAHRLVAIHWLSYNHPLFAENRLQLLSVIEYFLSSLMLNTSKLGSLKKF